MNRWRAHAIPIIAEVIAGRAEGCDEAEMRKAISARYPFGEREYWPYKIWLDEVKKQVGRRFPKTAPRSPEPSQVEMFS